MCGITGIVSLWDKADHSKQLKSMTDSLVHRGPDGEGFWKNKTGQVLLGHRRLSIIDLSNAGAQPMHYHDNYTIVYNGEIYNYKELKEDLGKKGFAFHSQSDTEVILAAYTAYREKCLDYFDGMFAFAIWDEKEQTLFAARDRFGEKPFFYYRNKETLFFASEIKALWAAQIEKTVNKKMLFNFLTLGYTTNPARQSETFFDGIHKLPAASFMKYHLPSGQVSIQQYWKLNPKVNHQAGEQESIEQFSNLLNRSVKRRLRSDVPVGTSLSGGLDSSSIVAMMKMLWQSSW